ncbi:YqzM family protein [Solibacillus sp. A46]|uniref:YqzM family protein n=2 Tax=Solibacillus TaxID=648800 RepID=A0ABR8XZ55_9BACL|nr:MULTISPECIES: YqzM family protein [Solibacillus]MBD8032048.1 YqzM family protein [Solibacillus merdavium]MBD8037236.1 YqzM family protein [Solibacillus faecavium]
MAGHQDPNYVTENPFEGRGRAMKGNDFPDAGYGFVIGGGFFITIFIIAIIVEAATRM